MTLKRISIRIQALCVVTSLVLFAKPPTLRAAKPTKDQLDFFESKIRPLLIEHCYDCHSHEAGESEGDLFLDSAAGMLKGGSLGPVLRPNLPDQSVIVKAIEYKNRQLLMPPDNKLPDKSIELIRQWIAMGAPDPRTEVTGTEEKVSPLDRDPKTHWAFVPPRRSLAPPVIQGSRDVVDSFAAKRAEEQGIKGCPPADRETIARRLYFDLTGLAPTKQQIESFVSSTKPDAYHRLVDQLLASPEFAERFARHWMDVARYADTVGYALGGRERRIKGSERYRDWIINAFASDMPYDQMIMHQIAADRTDPKNEFGNLDAMGFLTVGRRFLNNFDTIDDRIDVITRGLLGMTVACARCHDHKFDPIPASDYYSLLGVLNSSQLKSDGPSPLMMVDKPKPSDSVVFLRGQPYSRGPIAPRQFLTSLRQPDEKRFSDGSGRHELAKRIADASNPLTSRVMVNRIWSQLIGKPLVDSPSDFGFRTKPPAVTEALDDLSADFSEHWSIKRLVRRIVMTRIYRQSASASKNDLEIDPDNRYLARANRRRRDFESIRDSVLLISDSLDRKIGGESVEINLPSPTNRRTIYALIDRQNLPSLFRTFDFASPDAHSPQRYFTTVPQQALFLLNGRQISELSKRTANAIRRSCRSGDSIDLANAAFRHVLSRDPSPEELDYASAFLKQSAQEPISVIDLKSCWSYGTSDVDNRFRPTSFKPFDVFTKGRWQTAKEFPAKSRYGYASLGNENGHPGNSNRESVVRRYTAPIDGTLRVIGMVGHRGDGGDGIKATIWIGEKRVYHRTEKKSNTPYGPVSARIKKGEFVDIVASPGATTSFDSFFWRAKLKLTAADGRVVESDSVKDFSGPMETGAVVGLDRLAQLAQTLLMSNEFAFID